MNDFTKEELQIIHLDINKEINKHRGILKPSPFLLSLRDKVEKMIENYCDHEWIEYPNDFASIPYCKKCRITG